MSYSATTVYNHIQQRHSVACRHDGLRPVIQQHHDVMAAHVVLLHMHMVSMFNKTRVMPL